MKRSFILTLVILCALALPLAAGNWATNNFLWRPDYGESGSTARDNFDTGLTRADGHMGRHKTLGDPSYTTLAEALTTIGSDERTLVIPSTAGTVTVSSNTTIPANVHTVVHKGAKFQISDAVTLTINGPFSAEAY